MMSEGLLFYLCGGLMLLAGIMMVASRSAVVAACWLIFGFLNAAGIFALLAAPFLAILQVLVYAGAIMVLFLFVIMLLNLGRDEPTDLPGRLGGLIMLGVGTVLAVELWAVTKIVPAGEIRLPAGALESVVEQEGAVGAISGPLFRDYIVPFEITSVLLLAAVVGAVVLAKRRL